MSHKVETMAYTNEVPWHGLGTYVADAPSVDDMLKLAGLDWEVHRRPIFTDPDSAEDADDGDLTPTSRVKGFAALVRSTDGLVLDVVGSRYQPTQNAQAFEFFREFVEAGGATMETAGSLSGGQYVWGLANLGASFKMRGNDVVKGYLLVGSPHQQGKSLVVKFTSVRVVCNNTLTLALRKDEGGSEFRMSHRRVFDDVMMANAKEALGIARDQLGEFETNARVLQRQKTTIQDAINILAPHFAPKVEVKDLKADHLPPRLGLVIDALQKAPGAQPDNAWGILNAVTYYADHVASRTADKRLTNAWMGKTAVLKERVLDDLLKVAA